MVLRSGLRGIWGWKMMVYNPDEIEENFEEYNGGCWKCGKQLTLKDNQTTCDSCCEMIKWNCNSCNKTFEIVDKKTKKKLKECKICGYFICPYCGVCLWNCDKFLWQKKILEILKKDIPIGQFPTLTLRVNEIVEYVESIKTSKERKTCINNVPISYSKGRIKNLLAKVEGFRIKNENDRSKFLERIDTATKLSIGTTITINKIREDGNYGQEYRDALNLLVCLGKFKIEWLKNKDDKDYCVFVREDVGKCKYLANDDIVIRYCPKCKKIYQNRKKEFCDDCIWSKDKNIGQKVELKERLNNRDTCQLYRGNFKKGNGKA